MVKHLIIFSRLSYSLKFNFASQGIKADYYPLALLMKKASFPIIERLQNAPYQFQISDISFEEFLLSSNQ